jgi:phosphatidate cytidylyltransferase
MALNKSEFVTRSITGLCIGAVSIGAIVFSVYSYLAWLTIIAGFSAREYLKLERQKLPPVLETMIPILIMGATLLTGISLIRQWPVVFSLAIIPLIISLISGILLFITKEIEALIAQVKSFQGVMAYISLGILSGLVFLFEDYDWKFVLLPVLLIWVNDIMAYIIGSKWGKHKIAPSISPGKSIEGTVGAGIITAITGFAFTMIWTEIPFMYPVILGLFVPFFALAGDLWESALKRHAGVKDSGTILPGHGGFLDRYDSLLFVMPFSALAYFIFVL